MACAEARRTGRVCLPFETMALKALKQYDYNLYLLIRSVWGNPSLERWVVRQHLHIDTFLATTTNLPFFI